MDKIICLGKNYSDHIAEMKEPAPEMPVLFLKPPSAFIEIKNNGKILLPWERGLIHHECEVVFKLYKKNIIGLGLGLDLTLRDTQKELKAKGQPWEISKVFKNSAICTPIQGVRDFINWQDTPFILKVNGEIRQESKLSNAILKPNDMIHYIDKFFPICDGDLVFTGTPSGVGPLNPNDVIELKFGPIESTFQFVAAYDG
jgi:2-keto-4-pentenoate hydratase/2-oxohepta-3-ene-1,7-dioic acid hydratase in catechol pathway